MSDSNVQACAIRFIEDASYWIAALRERELHGIAAAMENLANERDALRAAQLHNRLVIAQHEEHLGRIQDELSESRSLLDEANADRDRLYKALEYVVRDLTTRANMKLRKEDRGVVDIGNGAWFQANDALEKHKAAPVPAQPAAAKGSTHCGECGCDWLDNGLNPVGCPYCKRNDDKFNPCLNSLVRQVTLMMDDCEEHADGSITIDCDISQGFLRRIYDLLSALEDGGYDAMQDMKDAGVYEEYEENET